ncbi:MAG: hypothetical protein COX81_01195 [Candidatus Magasanikbacteria bacterium CG_4_10_14_0_2_um_filter_37_12]|uniref:Uncharacterized protein n=1 Tax=Candidatus Magasanikbacteria bacterium CG_4_10_14_0_2_um_filter_37_12 TaxID=1974637 RepID=A0A2M7V8Z6_9BACT|nr:MAG: hypothetical protein COX81_01195 [Candidatus Magasanikbacteria bacterium CG_4_10_14_0_2_um_filter_37_12]
MLLGSKQDIQEHIVFLLSNCSRLSAKKIQKKLDTSKVKATVQGIYRALRCLQEDGVITKEKQAYSLRTPWILDLAKLLDTMENTYLDQDYHDLLLPNQKKEKRVWYFTNMLQMNNFWSQLLIIMANKSKTGIALSYCPHTWFENLQINQESQYRRNYFSLVKQFSIVGSNFFLDKYTVSKRPNQKDQEETYISVKAKEIIKNPNLYIDVIDDIVLEIKFDKRSTNLVEDCYKMIENEKDIDKILSCILKQKNKIKVTLQKNQKKAECYYKKFEKIFGPLKKINEII